MAEGRTAQPRDQRIRPLERLLKALDMEHLRNYSTKVDPIQTEAFYLEILERLAARVVALEVLAKRSEGHFEVLAALAERVGELEHPNPKVSK